MSFIREAIDRYDALARTNGARIVHSCGYDSVPSDLAVLLLHQAAEADGAGGLAEVQLVAKAKAGISGGTLESMRGQLDAMRSSTALRLLVADPYALSPDRAREPTTQQPPDAGPVRRSDDGTWTAPFIMAPFNTRIVRRSNALQGWAYGRSLQYGEVMGVAPGPAGAVIARAMTLGLRAFTGAMAFPPTRRVLDRFLPAPGTGPRASMQHEGWFHSQVTARTEDGHRYQAIAAGPGDPGYAATAVMAGETALALALDGDRLADRERLADTGHCTGQCAHPAPACGRPHVPGNQTRLNPDPAGRLSCGHFIRYPGIRGCLMKEGVKTGRGPAARVRSGCRGSAESPGLFPPGR